jgi:hypothetical protein
VSLLVVVTLIGTSVAASLAFPDRKHGGTLADGGHDGPTSGA